MELAGHANDCLDEMIEVFQRDSRDEVALVVMMALENAQLPASICFLGQVLNSGDRRLVPYAERTLQAIDTREARKMLFMASRAD